MKKIFLFLLLISPNIFAQDWVQKMNDPNVNFYTVQDAFNRYNEKYERKENNWLKKLFRASSNQEQEASGFEVFKRWEYFNEPRVYPSGNRLQPDLLWNEYQKYLKRNPSIATQSSGNWTAMGPDNLNGPTNGWSPGLGRVNVVCVDPVDSNIIYIGAPAGGLWKSVDGGATWNQPTTDLLPSIAVSAVAIDYTNTSIIYIGTGDCEVGDTYSSGVLKSTDGGQTWVQSGLTYSISQSKSICKLLIDPVDPNILFAATKDGIYKTINGGNNWLLVRAGTFRDMEFKPGNSQVIFAAGTSFFRSVDGGNSFSTVTTGLPSSSVVERLGIAVTPADSNYVYVAAGKSSDSGFQGLYKSVDGGSTFTLQSSSPNLFGWDTDASDTGGQSWYALTLCVSPTDPEKIYTGGVNIWESNDGGNNWQLNAHWLYPTTAPVEYVHADQHFMEFFGSVMYVGCDGGVSKSIDGGVNWSDISSGISISQFYCIGGSASNPALLMGGAQDNGCILGNNGIWSQVIGADGMEVVIDPVDPLNIYAESQFGTIYGSSNGGANMTWLTQNINESGLWVTPYMLDPFDPTALYAGYENVWRGDNGGTIWTKVSSFTGGAISILKVSAASPNYIFIIRGNSIFKSDDAGNTFTNISAGLPGGLAQLTYIDLHSTDIAKLWVTFSGSSANNKVFFSPDTGHTWVNQSAGLPNVPVNCVAYQQGTNNGIYIGTDMGVFYKDDDLSGWQPFWNGLPNVSVMELEPNYISNKLRAGTYGRGAWESDFYTINAPPIAEFTSDHQQICPGDSISFKDLSLDATPIWQWTFPGGNPSTSTLRNPVIYYNTIGDYDVTLTVQNSVGVDSVVKNSFIHVFTPNAVSLPLTEGFESGIYPPADWRIIDNDGVITWQESTVGGFGNSVHSAYVPNFNNSLSGKKDILLSPVVDLSQLPNPYLKFDVAYARIPNRPDSLGVYYTMDCGINKTYLYKKTGFALATGGNSVTNFVPTAVQWRTDSVMLPFIAGDVQIGFENTNGYGNNVYIDNINIYDLVVGVNELDNAFEVLVSPNPAQDYVEFIINGKVVNKGAMSIEVFDSDGRIVKEMKEIDETETRILINDLRSGLYIYNITNKDGLVLKAGKFVHL